MQITVKSTKVIKEGTRKDGSTYKWCSVMADDGSEKGQEYTTFDSGVLNLGSGAVIDTGEITIKEDGDKIKRSFQKHTVISAPAAPPNNGKSDRTGMTPELWAEKDRLERWSRECNTCFMGIMELAAGQGEPTRISGKYSTTFDAALDWALAHFQTTQPVNKPASKPPDTKSTTAALETDLHNLVFKDEGEFYTACLKYCKLQKSAVDKEIFDFDISTVEDRQGAWVTILAGYEMNAPRNKEDEKDPIDPEGLPKNKETNPASK